MHTCPISFKCGVISRLSLLGFCQNLPLDKRNCPCTFFFVYGCGTGIPEQTKPTKNEEIHSQGCLHRNLACLDRLRRVVFHGDEQQHRTHPNSDFAIQLQGHRRRFRPIALDLCSRHRRAVAPCNTQQCGGGHVPQCESQRHAGDRQHQRQVARIYHFGHIYQNHLYGNRRNHRIYLIKTTEQ